MQVNQYSQTYPVSNFQLLFAIYFLYLRIQATNKTKYRVILDILLHIVREGGGI